MMHFHKSAALAVLATVLLAGFALAQGGSNLPPSLGGALGNPGSTRKEMRPPEPKPEPKVVLPLEPRVVIPLEPPKLSEGATFILKKVAIEGATSVPVADLARLADPYLGKQVGTGELEELRQQLNAAYLQRGYINSGAVLPDQQVADGTVTFRVIEGRVADYRVEGLKHLRPGYVRDRLALGAGPPLNINVLSDRLRILLQDVNIARLNIDIEPGSTLGDAALIAKVDETPRWSFAATVANNSPPSVGSIRGEINATARSLTGHGDVASLTYGRTEGVNDGSASWAVPITKWDTILSFRYDHNSALVTEDIYHDLSITSRTQTARVAIAQPVYRTGAQTLTLGLGFERRSSKNFLLDTPFSFSVGEIDGVSRTYVLRAFADWLARGPKSVLALRATMSFGLPVFDATHSPQRPKADFQALLLQGQYVRRVHKRSELVLRGAVQLADAPLYSFEQFAIGGLETVRGYRTNALVRDNGAIGSAEIRVPVADLPLPLPKRTEQGVLQVVPFADFGNGWNTHRETARPQHIGSYGIGLRWEVPSRLLAQIYYAHAYRPLHRGSERDLQDSGVHFSVSGLF